MKKIVLLLPFILLYNGVLAINDKELNFANFQTESFRKSDLVFLGEVIKIDSVNNNCKMKIYEFFKGKLNADVIKVMHTTSNTFIPHDQGLWIVYSNILSDSTISINENSPTRSNINPHKIKAYNVPEPPKNNKVTSIQKFELELINFKITALTEWNNELYKLRKGLIK